MTEETVSEVNCYVCKYFLIDKNILLSEMGQSPETDIQGSDGAVIKRSIEADRYQSCLDGNSNYREPLLKANPSSETVIVNEQFHDHFARMTVHGGALGPDDCEILLHHRAMCTSETCLMVNHDVVDDCKEFLASLTETLPQESLPVEDGLKIVVKEDSTENVTSDTQKKTSVKETDNSALESMKESTEDDRFSVKESDNSGPVSEKVSTEGDKSLSENELSSSEDEQTSGEGKEFLTLHETSSSEESEYSDEERDFSFEKPSPLVSEEQTKRADEQAKLAEKYARLAGDVGTMAKRQSEETLKRAKEAAKRAQRTLDEAEHFAEIALLAETDAKESREQAAIAMAGIQEAKLKNESGELVCPLVEYKDKKMVAGSDDTSTSVQSSADDEDFLNFQKTCITKEQLCIAGQKLFNQSTKRRILADRQCMAAENKVLIAKVQLLAARLLEETALKNIEQSDRMLSLVKEFREISGASKLDAIRGKNEVPKVVTVGLSLGNAKGALEEARHKQRRSVEVQEFATKELGKTETEQRKVNEEIKTVKEIIAHAAEQHAKLYVEWTSVMKLLRARMCKNPE